MILLKNISFNGEISSASRKCLQLKLNYFSSAFLKSNFSNKKTPIPSVKPITLKLEKTSKISKDPSKRLTKQNNESSRLVPPKSLNPQKG